MLGLIVASSSSWADVYKYTAPDGKVYYTDRPEHKKYKLIIRSKPKGYQASFKYLKMNKKKYTPLIEEAATKHGIDPKLVHAVIYAESAYNSTAVSSAGAVGLMQLMPGTAQQYGALNRKDPKQNIFAGTQYLKYLLDLFNDDLRLSIAAYNAGENAVKKYNNKIPPYPETQKYVKEVLRLYQKSKG
ncbi:transglycosylase SLT domain-containing protein [Methyloprofundus sedimenti]|uniref:transglycosylase SLT domain-containing protein n=1 Tax=Methyloprofundus sedimenti TaxID=1420851 RepID=UPI001E3987B9|nr:transglycosylase SLT domain-containing protein [Methyloprofundus sedimenti]